MIKLRQSCFAISLFVAMLLLSGCKLVLLDPKGMIASAEKHILITSVLLMSIIVIPVIMLTFVIAWRYREGNTKATYSPNWSHSTLLEIIWWSIPCIIIGILAVITWISSHQLDPYKPLTSKEKPLVIQAMALEWKWLFIYPEQKIATVNFVQFPVGVPVQFQITAEGPMNSFQIPQLAGQIYAMAGMKTKLHLMADEPGDYSGLATNFSGDGFSEMKFVARVSSRSEFDQWVKTVKQSPDKLTQTKYDHLIKRSEKDPVHFFSFSEDDIFETAVMKSMMPMKESEMKNMPDMPTHHLEIQIERH